MTEVTSFVIAVPDELRDGVALREIEIIERLKAEYPELTFIVGGPFVEDEIVVIPIIGSVGAGALPLLVQPPPERMAAIGEFVRMVLTEPMVTN